MFSSPMEENKHSLGDVQYRKWHVYQMGWKDLLRKGDYHVCGAPFGGPVALLQKKTKKDEVVTPKLLIFSSSGNQLAEVPFEGKSMVGMGWSDQEQLVVVLEEGSVLIYNVHGILQLSFLLIDVDSSPPPRILECHFWGNGVVGMGSDYKLYVAESFASLNMAAIRKYPLKSGLSKDRSYTSMTIIPPLLSRSGVLEVLLGTQDNSVLVVDENEVEDQLLQDRISAVITKMAVAPNGRFLACYKKDGILTVMSSTFTTKVLDFDTKSVSGPLDIAWCGEDAVLLLWKNIGVVMCGPFGDWLNFPYDENVHLIPEPDCCRIISSSSCEMLQRVPNSTEEIFRAGSTKPAALLFDATEAFEEGDPKSDENIRSIAASNQLLEAVQSCIQTAASEFDVKRQQDLMKAASYGKAFCSDCDPTEFVETANKLRVLNTVRQPEVGIPLTMQQFNRLTPEGLVNRLTMRHHHFIALKICELLKLKRTNVLIHWASEKVKKMHIQGASDEAIRDFIEKKVSVYGKIPYVEVATAAHQIGRRHLATMILDMEQLATDIVPLLLQMGEEELALKKAIQSEDTDLVYLTLIHLETTRSDNDIDLESFYRLVYSHPEASNLLKMYYKNKVSVSDRSLLHNLLMYGKNYLEAGFAAIAQANMQPKGNKNNGYKMLIQEAVTYFDKSRALEFHKSVTEDQVDLIDFQKAYELRLGRDFENLSLSETLRNLVILTIEHSQRQEPSEVAKWEKEIANLVKRFKVSDKMLHHIKIQCYSNGNQWKMLEKLAVEKKSPIGFRPFALACVKYKNMLEAEKYAEKVVDPEERFELYMDIHLWRKAFEVAVKLKDPQRLKDVKQKCRDLALEAQILEVLSKL